MENKHCNSEVLPTILRMHSNDYINQKNRPYEVGYAHKKGFFYVNKQTKKVWINRKNSKMTLKLNYTYEWKNIFSKSKKGSVFKGNTYQIPYEFC